jgi:hypothetical protein
VASRQEEYERAARVDIEEAGVIVGGLKDELKTQAGELLDVAGMELGTATGELAGQAELMLERAGKEMEKPVGKIADQVFAAYADVTRDFESAGYRPQIYRADIQADLTDPDQLGVLLRQLAAAAPPQPGLEPNDAACVINPAAPGCTFNVPGGGPREAPPAPVIDPGDPNCFPAGAMDPANPGRLICVKGGPNEGGTTIPPVPIAPPPDEPVCPAPIIQMPACPAPVIVFAGRPPENPADLQPGECSPGDPDCKQPPEPVCPEPPVVNVGGAKVTVNVPEPRDLPKFMNRILPEFTPGGGAIQWDSREACDKAAEACDRWQAAVDAGIGPIRDVADFQAGNFGSFISNRLGIAQTDGGMILEKAFAVMNEVQIGSPLEAFVKPLVAGWSGVRTFYAGVKETLGEAAACALIPAAVGAAISRGASITGIDTDYFLQPLKYDTQFIFPVNLPTQDGIDNLYLTAELDEDGHECYTRALGNLPGLHLKVAQSQRSKLRDEEWIDLFYRQEVDDDRLFRELRKIGWLDKSDAARKVKLREQLPPFTDIIRFMVRDTESKQAVEFGGLDANFETNYTGLLQKYGVGQGITDDLAKRYWRAHWEWPSPTQLYEMLHRLRPGRVPDELAVDKELARKVLQIDDKVPAFVDRLLEISFHPLTRVDVRRMRAMGVLDTAEVTEAYLDLGYSPKDAKALTQFTEVEASRTRASQIGTWTLNKIASSYRDGLVDESFARGRAAFLLPTEAAVNQFIGDIDTEREARLRAICLKALKKRYMIGEFDYQGAVNAVLDFVIDNHVVQQLVRSWECERSARRKEIPARTLCKFLAQGIITQAQYLIRLGNLGYTEADAQRMLVSCGIDIFEKEKARAIREAKSRLDEYRRRLKEVEAELKRRQEQLEKLLQQLQEAGGNGVPR